MTFALVVCVLNWISIGRALRYRQEVMTTFFLPLFASVLMGAVALGAYTGVYALTKTISLAMAVSVPLAMVTYGVLIIFLKAVTEEELAEMPFGRKMVALCRKARLM